MNKNEKRIARFFDKLAHFLIEFHFYFYFVFSILIIISYYLKFMTIFNILSVIMLSIYIIELLLGYDRNFIGILGIVIFGIIGYILTNNINGVLLGITFAILFVNILKLIFNHILNRIINKERSKK